MRYTGVYLIFLENSFQKTQIINCFVNETRSFHSNKVIRVTKGPFTLIAKSCRAFEDFCYLASNTYINFFFQYNCSKNLLQKICQGFERSICYQESKENCF